MIVTAMIGGKTFPLNGLYSSKKDWLVISYKRLLCVSIIIGIFMFYLGLGYAVEFASWVVNLAKFLSLLSPAYYLQ